MSLVIPGRDLNIQSQGLDLWKLSTSRTISQPSLRRHITTEPEGR